MRFRLTQLGLHRIGDDLVDVTSTDEIREVLHASDLDRYTPGVHYVIVQDEPEPAPEPAPETDAEREAREKAEAEAAELAKMEAEEAERLAREAAPKSKGGRGAGARE